MPKPLFWIVHEAAGKRTVYVEEAYSGSAAMLKAAGNWQEGKVVEIHQLTDDIAKRVPKKMIGRALSQDEAQALLERIG
jgi:hypothetical protein